MNNETYGVKLEAYIKPFVDKIKQATQVSKQASDTIKKDLNIQMDFNIDDAKKRLKELETLIKEEQEFLEDFKNAPVYMKQENEPYKRSVANVKALKSEYNDLTNQIEKYNVQQQKSENTNKMLNDIFNRIKKSAKENASQIKRMTMSLIGVRSVYLMISRASSAYMSQDEELNQKMQASWASLGAILAPLLEYMANLMLTFAKAVNYVMLQLTGVDYVARALNKTLNTTKKQLSSIDEITNLGENTPFENLEKFFDDIAIDTEALDKISSVLKPIYDLIVDIGNFVSDHPNILAGLFAGFVASKIVGGIATIIGVSGGLTGLLGIATALSIIAGISIAETIRQFKELKGIIETMQNETKGNLETTNELYDAIRNNINNLTDEQKQNASRIIKGWIDRAQEQINKAQSQEEIDNIINNVKKLQDTIKILTGEEYEVKLKVKTTFAKDEAKGIIRAIGTTAGGIIGTAGGPVGTAIGAGTGFAISTVISELLDAIGVYDVGTNYVPNDQLALIHEGEMIVPKAYNPNAGYTGGNAETNALLYDIAEMLSGRQSATFEIDGKEFARATYNEFENERVRLNANTSLRRG